MRQRLLVGHARLVVAALVVVLVAVGLFVVVRSQDKPAASPVPTLPPGAVSPLSEALQGIREDGTWSKETALAVFAASFGPLPDVLTPRPDPSYRSGSLAIRMVLAYWSELTVAQQQAIRGYIGPAAATAVPAAYHPALAILFDTYQQIVDKAVADVAAAYGRPLGIPYKVVLGDKENDAAWAWATGDWNGPPGSLGSTCTMTFPPSTVADPSRILYLRWLVLHEVWHCFEYSMTDFLTFKASPPWVTEGSASWVAEAITGGVGAPPPELDHWKDYILNPGKPLYKRDYDAVGFYAQLAHNAIDPWKVIDLMVKAGGSDQAFQASGANTSTFIDGYGSSWFRDGQPSTVWEMQSGYGILPASTRAVPASIGITDGTHDTISAKPLAGAIAAVDTTAFVTRFEVSGVGRVADPAGSLDIVVRAGRLDLCTSPSGSCTCPPGSTKTPTTPDKAPKDLHAMASGEEHNLSAMAISGISKDDWCGVKVTPAPEAGNLCKSGCAGSNGDPHMRTVDKAQYDLQSVGEYVLLRSSDGTLEIQGRQERPSSGGNATVNTAVAVKVNGHRVGFYNTSAVGPASLKVDGVVLDAAVANLGPGATLILLPRGYELDFPDGSRLWVLAAAKASISITVIPSDALRASAVGLLARIPSNAGLRVPAAADGATFPVPLTPQERYHDIYELLAPSWRVTAKTSLFDYDAGKTTASYTLADFPPVTVPETLDQLDPTAVASAKITCAGVTDADLAEQCAYDVAVTGTTEFATLYVMSDDLQADGPASMSQPTPGTTPTPSPGGGGLGQATGVNLVADHLAGVASAALGPDGTVYLEVGEAGQGLSDFTRALLAVDPATGKVRQRALPVAYGLLATAAGSLWAGEFSRGDSGCEVTRLDPVTLAVQAQVTTVCSAGQTDFAAVGDAIWFVDPTGADAAGHGGHLKRIDPATNKVDTTPGGTIDLPFVSPVLHVPGVGALFVTTSQGLVLGDHQHGAYFLRAGGGAFQDLSLPANASVFRTVAGGGGVWTQTEVGTSAAPEGSATSFSADATNGAQVGINGNLVGADDAALYADQSDDDALPDELWRYPIDRSLPSKLAVGGFVPNGFGGQMRLIYRDPGVPLLVGDHEVVKVWYVASPTTPDQGAVMLQAAPIP